MKWRSSTYNEQYSTFLIKYVDSNSFATQQGIVKP